MLTVGDKFPSFDLTAVKGGAEGLGGPGKSFTQISNESDPGQWKVVFFWPKDFTFICPTEIAAFGKLSGEFADRDTVLLRRLDRQRVRPPQLAHPQRGPEGSADPDAGRPQARARTALGILDKDEACRLRATFIVDPGRHHPACAGQRPERRPQPAGDAARPRRAADRRALPVQLDKGEDALKPQELFEKAA
jgi:alkyl hydroperoxide reductase subunit AhpC